MINYFYKLKKKRKEKNGFFKSTMLYFLSYFKSYFFIHYCKKISKCCHSCAKKLSWKPFKKIMKLKKKKYKKSNKWKKKITLHQGIRFYKIKKKCRKYFLSFYITTYNVRKKGVKIDYMSQFQVFCILNLLLYRFNSKIFFIFKFKKFAGGSFWFIL